MNVGSLLAETEKDLNMCLLTVLPSTINVDTTDANKYLKKIKEQRHDILHRFIHYAVDRNVPMYTKMIADVSMADGVINEIKNDDNVKLVLMKWPDSTRSRGYLSKSSQTISRGSKSKPGSFE